jgi:hypothetical protein
MSTFLENQNGDMQQRNLMQQNNNWRFKYYKKKLRLSSSSFGLQPIKFYYWKSRIKSTNKTVAWGAQVIDASIY